MDAAVKHIRDGVVREDQGSSAMFVADSLGVLGGRAVFQQVPHIKRDRNPWSLIMTATLCTLSFVTDT